MLGQIFCKQTIGLVLLTRFQYIVHCLASVVGARWAPSLDRGQIGLEATSEWNKVLETPLEPPSWSATYLFASGTSKVKLMNQLWSKKTGPIWGPLFWAHPKRGKASTGGPRDIAILRLTRMSTLSIGLNKGFAVTKRAQVQRPSQMKGVSTQDRRRFGECGNRCRRSVALCGVLGAWSLLTSFW